MKGKGKRKRSRVGHQVRRRRQTRRLEDEARQDTEPTGEKILRGRDNTGRTPEAPSLTEIDGEVLRGQIVALRAAWVTVEPDGGGEPVRCTLRRSTRVPHASSNPIAVGDRVAWLVGAEEPHVLTEVEVRRTSLTRVRRGHEEHVIAANVDLVVVVASASKPPFKPRLVDRYLISAAAGGITPVLVVNKIDLAGPGAAVELLAPYAGLDFPAVATSAETGEGLDALRQILTDQTAVFSGQSGVGKSSLVNCLAEGRLSLATAGVYGKVGKGRHTTSASTLHRFPFGGAVIDTPGIRGFLLHEPSPEALEAFFPEIFEAAETCRFADCAHSGDEGCAVPEGLASGRIHPARLESFHRLMEEIRERR